MLFKKLPYLICIMLVSTAYNTVDESDIARARIYYLQAAGNETAANNLHDLTKNKTNEILNAYHGASLAIKAKYAWNPYKKLENVNAGLTILNKAVNAKSSDVEIRFLRFSVEENLPAIVPGVRHCDEDKKTILTNLKKEHPFYSTIRAYMLGSKLLSSDEKKKIP